MVMNNGQMAEIIRYRKYNDIDVKFSDGTIVKHKRLDHFKEGNIRNPNFLTKPKRKPETARKAAETKIKQSRTKRLGEVRKMANGLKAEIINYRRVSDIDIKFEDGYVLTTSYDSFKKGHAKHPNYKGVTSKKQAEENSKKRVGETRVNNSGLKMKIITYRTNVDIDVEFETGEIRKHVRYSNFKKGSVAPEVDLKEVRKGQTVKANDGSIVTLIEYRNALDVTVQFENGTTRKITYASFKNGLLSPEKDKWRDYIGTTVRASCGLDMTLVEGKSARDITIKFEDGTVVAHKRFRYFLSGNIAHPVLSNLSKKIPYYGFRIIKKAFRLTNGECFYYVFTETGMEVLTPQQMIKIGLTNILNKV